METGRGQRSLAARSAAPARPRTGRGARATYTVPSSTRTSNVGGWYRHIFLVARLQVERPLVAGADDAVLEDDALHEPAPAMDADVLQRVDLVVVPEQHRPRTPTSITRLRPRRTSLDRPHSRPSRPQSSSPGRANVRLYTDRGPVRRRRTRHGGTLHRTRRRCGSPPAPLAAAVGAEAIRSGGKRSRRRRRSAGRDGAAATKRGLGGDLIAPGVEQEPEPVALIAIGGAPAGLDAVAAAGQPHETGPSSVGPPGAAGRLPGAGRARHAATRPPGGAGDRAYRDGFAWAPISTALTHEAAALLRDQNPAGTVYLPDDRPISPGALVTLPGLALALEESVAVAGRCCTVRWVRR